VNFSDPFGLCREKDYDCHELVRQLRAAEGEQFQRAADVFERTTKEVVWVTGDDPRLGDDYLLNRDGDPLSWVGGRTTVSHVYLNAEFSAGDRLITAAHEARLHMQGPIPLPIEEYAGDATSFNQLPQPARGSAARWGSYLGMRGFALQGAGNLTDLIAKIKEPKR
jgi:hypothetical protein